MHGRKLPNGIRWSSLFSRPKCTYNCVCECMHAPTMYTNLRVPDAVVHEPISGEEAGAAIDVPYRHICCGHDSGRVQTELTEGRDEHESEVRRLDAADPSQLQGYQKRCASIVQPHCLPMNITSEGVFITSRAHAFTTSLRLSIYR